MSVSSIVSRSYRQPSAPHKAWHRTSNTELIFARVKPPVDEYTAANRALWDEWTAIHEGSSFYDLEGFKRGGIRLSEYEREEVGPVDDKDLLHLQCHFGLDTLSWARLGARVTGADFSEPAVEQARLLAAETGLEARFVVSDVVDLPDNLEGDF